MDEMTQQNAALVEQAAAAAESLQDQASSLAEAVAVFKVTSGSIHLAAPSLRPVTKSLAAPPKTNAGEVDFDSIILAHQNWKKKLRLASNEPREAAKLDPDAICKDNLCDLGKWIYGTGQRSCGMLPEFGRLKSKHSHFHKCAGDIAAKAKSGDIVAAKQVLHGQFNSLSDETVALIKQLRQRAESSKAPALPPPKIDADGDWQEF
jgi:methyl-accepting chemotaxis protein